MDISSLVHQGLQSAFNTLSQEVVPTTFHRRQLNGPYDPVTNSYPTDVYPNIPALRSQFDYREMATNQISIRDQKLIFKRRELPATPQEGDFFEFNGETWDVIRVFEYPGVIIVAGRRR